jgi:superfamily II DNA or RNA helicase
MIELRQYQNDCINQLRQSFANKNKRIVLCMPTGAGKTVVFSEMVRLAALKNTITLVLTDRTELFKQTLKALSNIGVAVEEINASKKNVYLHATIYLAMVETIKRRESVIAFLKPELIIIDEAHKGNFTKILDLFPDAKVIGATATPEGKHFFKYYNDIVQPIDIPELIEGSFLSNCKAYQMQDDFSDLEVKNGEYTDQSLFSHFDKPKLYEGVVDQWRKYALNLKTIVFCVNIEHTINTYNSFKDAGISCEFITSKTKSIDRNRILNAYKNHSFLVLLNCGILTTGYDEPSIHCVIMNRATKSLPLFLQCAGRGSRIYPDKEYFILLDFGMNHDRHGLWNEERKWSLKSPKKKKEGVAPVKICGNEDCGCMVHASLKFCNFCGYIFPVKESEPNEGIMVEVSPKVPFNLQGLRITELSINDLIDLERSKKYKSTFIWRVIRSMGEDAIKIYAAKKGYKNGWIYNQMLKLSDSEFTDYKLIN